MVKMKYEEFLWWKWIRSKQIEAKKLRNTAELFFCFGGGRGS